jgi:hypothetical protein
MEKTRTIEALNTLVNINNNTIEGYETISQKTDNQELRILFSQLARSGENRKQNLIMTIERMSKPAKRRIHFLRMWTFVKAALGKFNYQPQARVLKYEKI